MNTKRQQRLARAIEGLSGRDLIAFRDYLLKGCADSTRVMVEKRMFEWADDTLASERDEK